MATFFNIKEGDPAFAGLPTGIHDSISMSKIWGPLDNLWVQIPIFPFNHVISHNKTSKYCCFF